MMRIPALSLAPAAQKWLQGRPTAAVLHLFNHACNLINEQGEILSLVTESIGPGPFAVVLPLETPFSEILSVDSPVTVDGSALTLGAVRIETAAARLWQPRPDWAGLRCQKERAGSFYQLLTGAQPAAAGPQSTVDRAVQRKLGDAAARLFPAIAAFDLDGCRAAARDLAGVGIGLTPSGDDFLMGVIYALWASRPADARDRLVGEIVTSAAARTTSLSAAWLRAAARGEAVLPWHELVDALKEPDPTAVSRAVQRILSIGHSSGADALAGFTGGLKEQIE